MDTNIQEYIESIVRQSMKKIKEEKPKRQLSQRQIDLYDKARQIKELEGGEIPWCKCLKLAREYLDEESD